MDGVRRQVITAAISRYFAVFMALILAIGASVAWAADDSDPAEEAPPAVAGAATSSGGSAIKTSGLPVPRFVSIRSAEINLRTGPSTKYPIGWIFSRRGMPVEVVAEFDTWRRIRDREGSEGWVMQGMLSSKRSVLITGIAARTLRREPTAAARPVARAEPGVIAKLLHIKDEWCEIDADGYRGWVSRVDVWGIYPGERLE